MESESVTSYKELKEDNKRLSNMGRCEGRVQDDNHVNSAPVNVRTVLHELRKRQDISSSRPPGTVVYEQEEEREERGSNLVGNR